MIQELAKPADLRALARELADALDGFPVEELFSQFGLSTDADTSLSQANLPLVDHILGSWIETIDHDLQKLPFLAGQQGAAQWQGRLLRPRQALQALRDCLHGECTA